MKYFLLIVIVLIGSCSSKDSAMLAKVNGDVITVGEFKNHLRSIQFDKSSIAKDELLLLKKSALNEMIEEKIIQQECKKLNIAITAEDFKSTLESMFNDQERENIDLSLTKQNIPREVWDAQIKQKILAEKLFQNITAAAPQPSENEINDYYQNNPNEFHQQAQVHLQQIIMSDKEQAMRALEQLKQEPDFSKLAKAYAMTTDGTTGGDMGFVPKGLLPENVEKTVFSMKAGSISPILETPNGVYIMKVVEKKDEKVLTLEEARQSIQTMLLQKTKEALYSKWMQEKMLQANIKRNYETLQENIHL